MQSPQPAEKGGSIKVTLAKLEVCLPLLSNRHLFKDMIRAVQDDIAASKRECQNLRQEKEQIENQLTQKSMEVRNSLNLDADR